MSKPVYQVRLLYSWHRGTRLPYSGGDKELAHFHFARCIKRGRAAVLERIRPDGKVDVMDKT